MSVYFARVKGYVKIGYSADPFRRMLTLATDATDKPDDVTYGDEIELMGWVPGGRREERSMHMRFGHLHVIGEWFWDDDAYDEVILADEHGVPAVSQSHIATMAMVEHGLTRAEAEIVADSVASTAGMFSDEFIDGLKSRADDARADARAYWRSQRVAS